MTENALAVYLSGFDDDAFRPTVEAGTKKMLQDAGDDAAALADELGQLILTLKTGVGKQTGFNLLAPYVTDSESVRALADQLSSDDTWEARLSGAQALASVPSDPRSRARLHALLSDPNPNVKMFAVQQFPMLRSTPVAAPSSGLRVVPDDTQRDDLLKLLGELERAIYVLDETDLDDTQRAILMQEMLPRTQLLQTLVDSSVETSEAARADRRNTLVTASRLTGAASALNLAIDIAGKSDEAAENVKRVSHMIPDAVSFLWQLVS
jgi:hypothetical protein